MSDTLQPNALSIDPATGRVIGNFQGLTLPADTIESFPGSVVSRISWDRQSDGALVAGIHHASVPVGPGHPTSFQELNIQALRQSNDSSATAALIAADAPGAGFSTAFIRGEADNGYAKIHAAAATGATGALQDVTLIDSSGASGFLQLSSLANLHLVTGVVGAGPGAWTTGTWAGVSIPHNLGVIPKWMGAVIITGGSVVTGVYVTDGYMDTTQMTKYLYNPSPFNLTNASINWAWAALY